MDVNGIGQSAINTNTYSSDSAVSQYTDNSSGVAISQVKKIENQSSVENDTKSQGYSKKDLDNALKKINNFMEDEHTYAEYSIHKDFGTLMIKIVDEKTKQVILEVPPERILDMVASMCRQVGLFDRKV
ncbi:flagellin [Clostridium gelidum]|uniref:Flagellin n=1 Tax=Clostridium gelidum TaxID=704125 RepID=A0ABN6J6R8_9CLOT|nr:flagellar protein FlaG [Clostridium gelidum]BCZ48632.1 flagellin [Clostridium gelidum]